MRSLHSIIAFIIGNTSLNLFNSFSFMWQCAYLFVFPFTQHTQTRMHGRARVGGNPVCFPSKQYLAESQLEHLGLLLGPAHLRCFPKDPNFLAVETMCLSSCWMKTDGL